MSRSIAYNEAVIKQKDIELAELNKELDKMKEEQVKRLDEEAEKENKKEIKAGLWSPLVECSRLGGDLIMTQTIEDIIEMKNHTNDFGINIYDWFFNDLENNYISKLNGTKKKCFNLGKVQQGGSILYNSSIILYK
ncbi:hypothetical protein RWE15_10455 [Virgibacillus halophilus]|uniref:Uncharacterized protein n=1 Tax=Tigheibacillus halophilus TaxID=361280 RepID=A0ABU5C655_9BACI|nr:hypothetical protein [Virgibacillus halophilus]